MPSVLSAFVDEVFDTQAVKPISFAEFADCGDCFCRGLAPESFGGSSRGHDGFNAQVERKATRLGFGGELRFDLGLEAKMDHAVVGIALGFLRWHIGLADGGRCDERDSVLDG